MEMDYFETKRKIYSVTEITRNIKETLETRFANVWLEGEISTLRRPGSGHIYFTLKDEISQIKAVIFKYNNQRLRFELEDGLKIVGFGTVGVYEKRGEYQIILEVIEPLGLGALQLAFEKLKKKLEAEGLFANERKRPIPLFPKKIGIVTSPTGAVVRDILNIINRRFCNVHIIIYPVRVQGEGSAQEISDAIREFNKFEDIDVMIIGRGGGSLEDLWAFNEEIVARAIYESKIPIISAVGHEIDFTIADFVADLRAPTPSAAAELVVQNKSNIENTIKIHIERIVSSIKNTLSNLKNKTDYLTESNCFIKPEEIVQQKSQMVDEYHDRINELILNMYKNKTDKIDVLYNSIIHLGPFNKITQLREKAGSQEHRLISGIINSINRIKADMNVFIAKLDILSPLAILSRGYSITFTLPDKKLLIKSTETSPGKELEIKLAEGEILCEVKKVTS
ncbi:exodeoxyribonuclease VII large subunit [Candidatus Poribacteria bacterium]|nr:exodeoxyribonuclease VII large subunit [Candidatus Poribacteria bacterium]